MQILTATELWQDSNFENIPLDTSIIKKYTLDEVEYIEMYFTGNVYQSQKSRVYCRMARRLKDISPPVLLLCDEPTVDIAKKDISQYLNLGYAIVQYDYAGVEESRLRYTIYPPILDNCNYFLHPQNITLPTQKVEMSCWYEWSLISFRTVLLIKSLPELDATRIVILGIGLGGVSAVKTATMYNSIIGLMLRYNFELPIYDTDSMTVMNKAALGNGGYIKYINIPTLLQISSNEEDGSFDALMEKFDIIQKQSPLSRVSVAVSKNHNLDKEQISNESLWLSNLLYPPSFETLYPMPILTKVVEGGYIYISLNTGIEMTKKVSIFISENNDQNTRAPAYRYWQGLNIESINDKEYNAKTKVYCSKIYSIFANIEYTNGFYFSSQIINVTVSQRQGSTLPANSNRLIYDSDMGVDNFTEVSIDAINKGVIEMDKGPFDIEGVSGKGGELAFFKFGYSQFIGNVDSVLQLTIYSNVEQELEFTVVSSDGYIEYKCKKTIKQDNNWTKMLLTAEDFKGIGTLDFSKVVFFKVNSAQPIIISNMIWL